MFYCLLETTCKLLNSLNAETLETETQRGALLFAVLLTLSLSSPHAHIISLFPLSPMSEGNISKCALSQSCLNAL